MGDYGFTPYDLDAEEAVLGSILIDDQSIHSVIETLDVKDFYRDKNQWTYAAARRMHSREETINQITLAHEITQMGRMDAMGGSAYLGNLVLNVPTSIHIKHYAAIVKRLSTMRDLIGIASKIAGIGYDSPPDADEAVSKSLEMVLGLKRETDQGGLKSMFDVGSDNYKALCEWIDGKGSVLRGITTGFTDLDKTIDGLEKGKFYLAAGRPGMGKTQLLLNIARLCSKKGLKVAIFSLEQNERAVMERLIFSHAMIDRFEVRKSGMTQEIEDEYWRAYAEITNWPLWIDSTADITTQTARARLMSLQAEQGVDLMLFDYIDIAGDDAKDGEEMRIGLIARRLRAIAKTMDIPVLATGQLNREVEKRPDKKPILSDLRYSGALEQIADVVMLLYSREYYEQRGMLEKKIGSENKLEVHVAKNKDGPVATVDLHYNRKTGFMHNEIKEEER